MKIAILGDGGLARELALVIQMQGHEAVLFGKEREHGAWQYPWALGVGSPPLRKEIASRCPNGAERPIRVAAGARNLAYPPPGAAGLVILAGVQVTVNVTVGAHVLINLNVTIGHDTRIGDYSVINPGANISGHVTIGECVLVGAGACIREGVTIGDGATVGMGAVVLKDVPAGEVWVGNPARRLR